MERMLKIKSMAQSKLRISSCIDLAIDVPDFLDLNRLRAAGLQVGEEELPDLMPPIVLPEDTRGMKRSSVHHEVEMVSIYRIMGIG